MTTEAPLPSGSSVLIIDNPADCRDVLATVLRRRGVQTCEVGEAGQALDVLRRRRFDVVVLDMESDAARDDNLRRQCGLQACDDDVALVMLGRVSKPERGVPGSCVIAKPYHYAAVIRTIERLLVR